MEFKLEEEDFDLNCLPEEILSHKLFKSTKELFFYDFAFNPYSMKVEIKEANQTDRLSHLQTKLNKLLKEKFKL
jgi:hypothetical protein